MGLDRRNWRKPYTPEELKDMLNAAELQQLRTTNEQQAERIKQLEDGLREVKTLLTTHGVNWSSHDMATAKINEVLKES